jgi:cyclopropane fatty-acyl-phospholipid synthase-like methyltransferase
MSDLEHWEARFAGEGYRFGTEPNAFLARQAALLKPGMEVLSIADGEGRNGVWLAGQGCRVTAQDFSPTAQAKARALAEKRGVTLEWELSDLTGRGWEANRYDAVVGIFFQFLPPPVRDKVFACIRKTVRPGGLVLIEGYGPKQLDYGTGGPGKLENLYTEAILRDAFAGFAELWTESYDAEVREGAGHSGMSALVDMVARR